MPQEQLPVENWEMTRRYRRHVQSEIVVTRPPPEEPMVRTALTFATPLLRCGQKPLHAKYGKMRPFLAIQHSRPPLIWTAVNAARPYKFGCGSAVLPYPLSRLHILLFRRLDVSTR